MSGACGTGLARLERRLRALSDHEGPRGVLRRVRIAHALDEQLHVQRLAPPLAHEARETLHIHDDRHERRGDRVFHRAHPREAQRLRDPVERGIAAAHSAGATPEYGDDTVVLG